VLNTREAAEFLGLKESTLRGWRCAGKLDPPFYTISPQRVMYDLADLQRYKSERRCASVPHTLGHHAALSKSA
jgi:predicted site-specific integrase-resolvase